MRRGAHIFRMGDPFEALYMVRSGAVKTYWLAADGEQQVTGFYLPGDIFGLDSVTADHYVSSAVALDTSGICTFSYRRLQRLCRSSEEVNGRLLRLMSEKIRESEQAFITLGHKSAEERMAWFLLNISHKRSRLGLSPFEINLPMTRTDIGSFLMLAVETVSRVLTRLQSGKIIKVQRNRVTIRSVERLAKLAESCEDIMVPAKERSSFCWGICAGRKPELRPITH